ncbi:hypothetical protein [Glycomyces harbinensis]|uniref:Excreted virulence factor EspC, type VII ESX diderm n=1 Tax=Glycomyces harbinensis TaxID=58114 RepID=A0A1G7DLP8_9ACTN|nr:hypothetical protein [Glycomyces harbinensis]SDE52422.1 Excreted virulence factor EspC, type VII ESX diderm [Glycomyces harbinensis]
MGSGYTVDPEQLRQHASTLEALQDRFAAITSASSYIEQDDEAYGLLCGWISGCLEDRHQRHATIVEYVAENLGLAAQAVRACADDFETSDEDTGRAFRELESRMGN